MEMEEAIVLYSTPEHLNSLTCLAIFITKHYPSISVVLLCTTAAPIIPASSSITYRRLPTPSLPPNTTYNPLELFFENPRHNNPNFRQALAEISQKSKIKAIVLDFFCNYAFEVTESFSIPTYFCDTTSAFGLCLLLYWPTLHETTGRKLGDFVEIPGCPVIPSSDLPVMMHFPKSLTYKHFMDTAINTQKSAGVISNALYALEARALQALENNLCTPNLPTPPVYAMPLVDVHTVKKNSAAAKCMQWLDSQPNKSVILLCFGRKGEFSAEQLREMAVGLENSGYRFVWAVRSPRGSEAEEPDLEAVLPEGFLERTEGRGVVLKSWAPQTEVLSHEAVGGFVTHCGQSSMLEAVSLGVPMICWPLYAEQKMNRVFMVEEMKVGLTVEEAPEGFVTAAELEKRIRELMETRRGKEIGRRVADFKVAAAAAVREGGSAVVALDKFMAQ